MTIENPRRERRRDAALFPRGEEVRPSLEEARRLLLQNGWAETKSERFVNPEKFPGVWAAFAKGDDTCRVTAIEGTHATHVEYAVARVNPPR